MGKPEWIREEGGYYDRDPRRFKLRVAVVYPGPYRAAVNSLGYQLVYYLANSVEGVMAERFTSDSIASIDSGLEIGKFDVMLVSVHYEGQLHTLLEMLRRWGIHSRKEKRRIPIIAGGQG